MIKKPIVYFSFVLAISIAMIACEENYYIDTGDFESKLVVNSLFDYNSPWAVHVSNSHNILDHSTDIENISDARVEIFDQEDKFLYELYHQGNGIYGRDDYAPSPTRGYSVKVSASGYRAVTAKSYVPEKSTLTINNFTIINREELEDGLEVDFEIKDESDLEAFYIWEIVDIEEDGGEDGPTLKNQLAKTWIDDLKNNPDDLVRGGREILAGGVFGNGIYSTTYNSIDGNRRPMGVLPAAESIIYEAEVLGESKLNPTVDDPDFVYFNTFYNNDKGGGDGEESGAKGGAKFELRVMSISRELYDYYSSVEDFLKQRDNHSGQIPAEIYTNVTNGLGVFAGFSESVVQF